jgi:hypothetical protein
VLNLATPTSVLQIIASTPGAITVQASGTDLFPNSLPLSQPQTAVGWSKNTLVTTPGVATTVVSSPATNTARNVKYLLIANTSGAPCTITVQHFDGGVTVPIFVPSLELPAGWVLEYATDGSPPWAAYDTAGVLQVEPSGAD